VFLHRCKDTQEDVRLTCFLHLKDLILFDPERNLKGEYLKYLARGFHDRSHAVRMESIQIIKELIEDDKIVRELATLVMKYMDRFIEIAKGDVDTDISVEMISAMRTMQR
jgi:cohesin complex subunit SA-1/2